MKIQADLWSENGPFVMDAMTVHTNSHDTRNRKGKLGWPSWLTGQKSETDGIYSFNIYIKTLILLPLIILPSWLNDRRKVSCSNTNCPG